MKIEKATKKPVQVEAVYFGPDVDSNELARWCGGMVVGFTDSIKIPTLEGTMIALRGDWIIRGVKGEFYPCKEEIFEATYEILDCCVKGC